MPMNAVKHMLAKLKRERETRRFVQQHGGGGNSTVGFDESVKVIGEHSHWLLGVCHCTELLRLLRTNLDVRTQISNNNNMRQTGSDGWKFTYKTKLSYHTGLRVFRFTADLKDCFPSSNSQKGSHVLLRVGRRFLPETNVIFNFLSIVWGDDINKFLSLELVMFPREPVNPKNGDPNRARNWIGLGASYPCLNWVCDAGFCFCSNKRTNSSCFVWSSLLRGSACIAIA